MNDDNFITNIMSSNFLFFRRRNYVTISFTQEVHRKQKETNSDFLLLHYKDCSSFRLWHSVAHCLHTEYLVLNSFLEIILKGGKLRTSDGYRIFLTRNTMFCVEQNHIQDSSLEMLYYIWWSLLQHGKMEKREGGLGYSKGSSSFNMFL